MSELEIIPPVVTEGPKLAIVVAEKFAITNESLVELVNGVKDLRVNGVEDKDGLKKVESARKMLKAKRVEISKHGKGLRDSANKFSDAVIAREKELIGLITPTEDVLEQEEDRIEQEKQRIRVEDEKRREEEFQKRVAAFAQYNFAVDFFELRYMSDEVYQQKLAQAADDFQAEELRKAEAAKIEEELRIERLRAESDERERLLKVAVEQEAERDRLESIRRENEKREAALKAESDRIEREKRELAEAKQRELDEKYRRDEEERKRIVAIGDQRYRILKSYGYEYPDSDLGTMPEDHFNVLVEVKRDTYEEEQKRIAIEKAEADRQERERLETLARERAEALRPDKEKIENFAAFIGASIEYPEVRDEAAQRLVSWAKIQIDNVSSELFKRLDSL